VRKKLPHLANKSWEVSFPSKTYGLATIHALQTTADEDRHRIKNTI